MLAQADIPDETFAQGILGPGCGIEPTGDTVYAPFDGTVLLWLVNLAVFSSLDLPPKSLSRCV